MNCKKRRWSGDSALSGGHKYFLEIMLEQKESLTAKQLLNELDKSELFLSDFSFHSIGVILFRLNKLEKFSVFIDDILNTGIRILKLTPTQTLRVINASTELKLDFDDAYQYIISEVFNLEIISFDQDFDKLEKGRRKPNELIL